ncbi:hypothetical protein PoB_000453900 [Plakobranchus ocellatus]|uniref:Uncharacterized protein n=1 Tax=Plakobranchus ocellatus TaxID=259542 RepID=A0AAV3Y6Y9_9GAST|nr:hypothetical protein PoB_000453900 [Plakobranchus ocellatus]
MRMTRQCGDCRNTPIFPSVCSRQRRCTAHRLCPRYTFLSSDSTSYPDLPACVFAYWLYGQKCKRLTWHILWVSVNTCIGRIVEQAFWVLYEFDGITFVSLKLHLFI